ncbi:MAG TPA: hypothetical protein VGZ47_13970, partial [Gemmataceae bacterium]|nr:hypothetical protein [Gemmataceae bacterium]
APMLQLDANIARILPLAEKLPDPSNYLCKMLKTYQAFSANDERPMHLSLTRQEGKRLTFRLQANVISIGRLVAAAVKAEQEK